ncbi:vitamin K epoxide reductase family protein [Marinimicrobium sp. ABcell2]|uniref:vitamin K epoxide reductase family protein n=1 Tax=Marinimicrobium sp. ABcell2 TaxID=3069751 RepID=UPI0027B7C22B|nr:vitamin K epoxide reductase family protein [Marinimicrobium sp. ABcell2]MDQ2075379.1 vitamin K epoxide reductase family protein [Marinimicrobium sp. ABcell2]
MAKARNPKRKTPAPSTPNWPVLGLALIGMALTAYLSVLAWLGGGGAILCGPESGCDVIQQSRWSQVMGLPLAFWGFLLYGLMAGLAWRGTQRLKDWRRLWTLALIALAISLYLTVIGLWQLSAVCLWCLASLAIIGAIFTLLTVKRPTQAPGTSWTNWLLNRGVVAVLVVGALHFYYNYDALLSTPPDDRLTSLAQHLDETGARYFGASWCAACQQQNALFGDAKEHLPYIECTPHGRHGGMALECSRADIRNFPTWIIDGERHIGVLQPRELARHSGFDWDE